MAADLCTCTMRLLPSRLVTCGRSRYRLLVVDWTVVPCRCLRVGTGVDVVLS